MEQQIEGRGHAEAAQRVTRRTHVVMAARAPAGAGRAEVVAWLWKALCERCPSLERFGPAGVGTVDLEDGRTVRWASDPAGGAIACEVIDIAGGDWWEAFLVHVGDGGIRTGWRRRGAHLEAPPVWEDAVVRLALEGEVRARSEPHFLSLVASICAEGDVSVSSSDLQEREGLEVTLAHYKALSSRQAAAIRTLRSVPRVSMGGRRAGQHDAQEVAADQPWTLPDLERWADENADRIVVLPRAIAEAKKSPYEDHQLVFQVLEMLAETYRKVKLSEMDRAALKDECERLGVSIGGSVHPSRAGEAGGEYHVTFEGRKRFLDQHIGKGSSRDARFCLRVYFFWSEESKRAVVGWLPSHLTNSMT